MSVDRDLQPPPARRSGTPLIVAMLVMALVAAVAGWWFRYTATRRAAQFWGPAAALLIRDAPVVKLIFQGEDGQPLADGRDVSHARGLVHLRNALLEDHSFHWPARDEVPGATWEWALAFSDPAPETNVVVWFSADCGRVRRAARDDRPASVVACAPIADGLATFFAEQTSDAPAR